MTNFTLLGYRDKLEQLALSFCQSLLPDLIIRTEWLCRLLGEMCWFRMLESIHSSLLNLFFDLFNHTLALSVCFSTFVASIALCLGDLEFYSVYTFI